MIGKFIIRLEETVSTNAEVIKMMENEPLPDGTAVMAAYQSGGKGYGLNSWESEREKNLLISILLYPVFIRPDRQFLLNIMVANAIQRTIAELTDSEHVTVKWPNDIYYEDRKISGMLIRNTVQDSRLNYSIIGIGINVNQAEFHSDAPNPVSLYQVLKGETNLENCYHILIGFLNEGYKSLAMGEHVVIREYYEQKLYRANGWHPFSIHGRRMEAKIEGIDEFGRLILMGNDGELHVCDQKEVEFIPD